MRKLGILAAILFLLTGKAEAAVLNLYPGQNVSFGEGVLISLGAPAAIAIDPFSGAVQRTNLTLIATPALGSFVVEGSPLLPMILTISASTPACDTTYVNPCLGTPSVTLTNNFAGYITGNYCPKRPKCQDTVNVGGTLSYPAGAEGRWTMTVLIVVNYQ